MAKKYIKIVSLALILGMSYFGLVSANEISRKIADDYIKEMEGFGPFWKDRNPTIVSEVPFYTYDDKTPSYIEYKVSCDDERDCGYVMVNIDGTDVEIPESSTMGKTLSEQMKGFNKGKNKNYYFDVFNQFALSDIGEITSVNPEYRLLNNGKKIPGLKNNNLYEKKLNEKNPLYEKFNIIQGKSLKNKFNNTLKQKSSTNTPIFGNNSAVIHNEFFNKTSCKSITPCYYQFDRTYTRGEYGPIPETSSVTGCTPTAISIIFGFYDKYGYPNIIKGDAPSRGNKHIKKLQYDLGELMETYYKNGGGATKRSKTLDGFNYLNNIYSHNGGDRLLYNSISFWNNIKTEINAGRPLMINYDTDIDPDPNTQKISGHIIVVHGYSGNKLSVNFGFGYDSANKLINLNGNTFTGHDSGTIQDLYTFKLY